VNVPSTVVIFIGIQATGKTTFFKERYLGTHTHISLDLLKTRFQETEALDRCFANRESLVVDNTNPTRQERAKYLEMAHLHGYRAQGYYFRSNLSEALARNSLRTGKHRIPDLGIKGTSAKLEVPTRQEGFNELFHVRIDDSGRFNVEVWNDEI
jgi:predicted kinase